VGKPVLAFECGPALFRSEPDGKAMQRLTSGKEGSTDRHPGWSPDGSLIAFSRRAGSGKAAIYVMRADGSGVRQISEGASNDTQPAWSSNGSKIAFTTDRDGNLEVYAMDADGQHPSNLSRDAGRDFDPSWTPDGDRVVFTSDREGHLDVFVADVRTPKLTRLTDSAGSKAATWSPDGRSVVVVAAGVGLALIDLTTATVSPITTDATDDNPSWSPVGNLIAFQRGKTGRTQIYVVGPDGKHLQRVTAGATTCADPAWGLVPG
jgi:Tol biopolymer transport system component